MNTETLQSNRSMISPNSEPLGITEGLLGVVVENARLVRSTTDVKAQRGSDQLWNQPLSGIAHDLRAPLTVIKGYTTMLLDYDGRLDHDEVRRYLESIEEASDRLAELIDQLQDQPRPESGALGMKDISARISALLNSPVAASRMRDLQPVG
ncbi:MAG: histidine kinase dimerization/phospho-acceptor domain-containing protein [Dehalococcoidia bacterium]|nr:histidine kinase dimerization/phospho-acceptor domain-containing protein [Dehalococcoidia bacterium]